MENVQHKMNANTLRLVQSAVMVGLATVLSLVKLWQMPFGGSVTLCSMLPIMLIAYRYGVRWGLLTGFVYSLVQLVIDIGAMMSFCINSQSLVGTLFLDYLIAFTLLGLAGIYGRGFVRYLLGMVTAVFLRFVSHVLSGVIVWSSTVPAGWKGHAFLYSIVYNGAFLLPDLLLCLVAGAIIYKPLKRFLET